MHELCFLLTALVDGRMILLMQALPVKIGDRLRRVGILIRMVEFSFDVRALN